MCGGTAVRDACGVCEGGNADMDCAGECYGEAQEDCAGVCNGFSQILSYYLDRYRDSYKRSLCAYNAGWSRCKSRHGTHKGYRYAQKVTRLAKRLDRETEKMQAEYLDQEYVPGCYE